MQEGVNIIVKNYGITKKVWLNTFRRQGKKCACCRSIDRGSKRDWHTDHDHKTKVFRGIVCRRCNLLFGQALDSVKILKKAIKYLERSRAY